MQYALITLLFILLNIGLLLSNVLGFWLGWGGVKGLFFFMMSV